MTAAIGRPAGSFVHSGDPRRHHPCGLELPIGIQNDRNVTVTWDNWSVSSQSCAGGP